MAEQPLHLDPEERTKDHYVRNEGTDPEISNEIANVISDVFDTYNGGRIFVPFSVRFGIAHEVQRRLNVSKKEE